MRSQAQTPSIEAPSPCIARQPILTADEKVVGYELFFRERPGQDRFTSDVENATSATIDALNMVGLDVLCDGRPAFINCTRHMLLTNYFALLPPGEVVIEIQETVPADESVKQACEGLKRAGYSIALDNFVPRDPREALVPFADFIKVDILAISLRESARLASVYGSDGCRMLAQKVETREKFVMAEKSGFTLFQGYFFRHPENLRARRIPANQLTYVRLLSAISKAEVDFTEIEDLIKHEPALCYRLLRYLNSPVLGLPSDVLSVRHALNLLGERESIRWIRMATTLVMGQEKSSDLVLASLVRARFCELIAPRIEHGNSDLFLLGMLSLMDAILSVPIGILIEELYLDPAIKAQLLCAKTKTGTETRLTPVYELMIAREEGEWERVMQLGKQLKLSLSFVAQTSNEAMRWAREVTNPGAAPRSS
ncbi:MAG: EAL and HDOD domain-containing protein [Terriglobales bacterium]|jgi:c-di-GMP-related signal transduction protein